MRSGGISSIATVVVILLRKFSLRASKSATDTLLLVVPLHFTKPIRCSRDCAHVFFSMTGPPYSARSPQSSFTIIPRVAVVTMAVTTDLPLSWIVCKYAWIFWSSVCSSVRERPSYRWGRLLTVGSSPAFLLFVPPR